MSREYRVTVPIKPQAATRPRTTIKNGQARTYNSERYKQWTLDFLRVIVGRFSPEAPKFTGPVAVEYFIFEDKIEVYVTELPVSRRGKIRGDGDNIEKAISDGLQKRGVIKDDKQIEDARWAFKA